MSDRIRIAIGSEPRTEIARKVLEYSIIKQTKSPVDFQILMGKDYDDRGDLGEGTGFSLLRFSVPERYRYQGFAIYLDADMLLLSDIRRLWDLKRPNGLIWTAYGNEDRRGVETSVMLINCQMARGRLKPMIELKDFLRNDPDRVKYREVMKLGYLNPPPIALSKWWNVMDKGNVFSTVKDFSSTEAKLLHYTQVRKQPWYFPEHPKRELWGKWFKKAVKEGYLSGKEIKEAIKKFDISNPRRPNGLHPFWEGYSKEQK